MKRKILILFLVLMLTISLATIAKEKGDKEDIKISNLNYMKAVKVIANKQNIELIDKTPEFMDTDLPYYEENKELFIYAKADVGIEHAMLTDTKDFLKALSKAKTIPEKICIVWQGGIEDRYGNVELGNWMIYSISKEDLLKINWKNTTPTELPKFDPNYYIHKDFK